MSGQPDEWRRTGTFTVLPDKELYGELTLNGANTSLCLHDKKPFSTRSLHNECVTGVLHDDLTKVTLIDCITMKEVRGNVFHAHLFPHFVVYGDYHLDPTENAVTEVHFIVDDAMTLFYDFGAFGSLIDARPFIEQIANANAPNRKIMTGPDPIILYFSGKREIFVADTVIGRISASHNPSWTMGGPGGARVDNTIIVAIAFKEATKFDDAILHTLTLIRYLGVLVGRPQNLLRLSVRIKADQPVLQVYSTMLPKHGRLEEDRPCRGFAY
jgi:ApeA N-terminal domain 1